MKKCVTMLLAIIMLMGTLPLTALAEEISPELDQTLGYELTDSAPDANTDARQLLEDLGIVTPDEDYDWEAEWAAQRRQEKVEMGMPYPDGVNVSLNGKYLDFGGIAPIGDLYNAMIPFRAFLEGLGGKVAYQDGKFIATMPDGMSIMAEPDSTKLSYTVGDKINTILMYEPPVVENRVTYVEVEALGSALGLDVDYDDSYDVLHLTDWDAVAAEIDEDFTSLNALLAAGGKAFDPEKTYDLRINGKVTGSLYAENRVDTASLSAGLNGLISGKGLDMSLGLKLDQGSMKNTVFAGYSNTMAAAGLTDEGGKILDLLSDFRMDVRNDFESRKMWMRGNKLSQIPGSPLPDSTWLEGESSGELPAFVKAEEAERVTVGELLTASPSYSYGGTSPSQRVLDTAKTLAKVIGDDTFTVTKSGTTTTYRSVMGLEKLLESLDIADVADLLGAMNGAIPGADWDLTFRVKEEALLDCKVAAKVKVGGANPTEVALNMSATQESLTGTFSMKATYGGKLECKLDASMKETTRTVTTKPGAGEKVERMDGY